MCDRVRWKKHGTRRSPGLKHNEAVNSEEENRETWNERKRKASALNISCLECVNKSVIFRGICNL